MTGQYLFLPAFSIGRAHRRRWSLMLACAACLPLTAQVCIPAFMYGVEPICNVTFAGLDHDSPGNVIPAAGFEDFTAFSATVERGRFYPISVAGNTMGAFNNDITVFFDWNQDGVFETAEPLGSIHDAICNKPVSGFITVPPNAVLGTTRMRVIKNDSQIPTDPCGSYGLGQAEDYSIHVVEASIPWYCNTFQITHDVEPICWISFGGILNSTSSAVNQSPAWEDFTGAPAGSEFTYMAVVEQGGVYPIGIAGNTAGPFTNYITAFFDWDQDGIFETVENIGTIGNVECGTIEGMIGVPHDAALGITRMRIVKNYSSFPVDPCGTYDFGQAEDYTVYVAAPSTPVYCGGTNFGSAVEPICRVQFAGIDHTSSADVDHSPALEDFTAIAGSVNPGWTYPMTVWGNTDGGYTNYVTAFFDWDRDGSFETEVQVGSITDQQCGSTPPMDITVPLEAVMGVTRMRVVKNFGEWPSSPCDSYNYGQAEDYSLYVNPPHYCGIPAYGKELVNPICNVTFAGIDNDSPPEVNGSPIWEDFTSIMAQVQRGSSYPVSITGNTDGNVTGYVTVYFDWDQDSLFEASVQVGSLTNSLCGNVITATVPVPADAWTGVTRMRVVHKLYEAPTDPCGSLYSGQAEDYSVLVDFGAGLATLSDGPYRLVPNPAYDRIELLGPRQGLLHMEVLDLLGHRVLDIPAGQVAHVGGLARGTYMLLATDDHGQALARLWFMKL